jgi:hypothetical protein
MVTQKLLAEIWNAEGLLLIHGIDGSLCPVIFLRRILLKCRPPLFAE